MLVLGRRVDEAIIINGNIRVAINEIRGDMVKIGIDAPPEITVDREEIHERKNRPPVAEAACDVEVT